MMETRIEIETSVGTWEALRLKDAKSVRYNAVINRIGKIETREISHTNTFSLPDTFKNKQVLGINIFNPKNMSLAFNRKYNAKYYIEDQLLKEGFLIVNNTIGGTIQVNFIDGSLSLTDNWSSTTYHELLSSPTLAIPADYVLAIAEMKDYVLDVNAVLPPLSDVGVRGYKLALFPNNLNNIGEKFQINDSGVRVTDVFNPYQSRPLMNAKAFIEICIESYGYTVSFETSVDIAKLEKSYIVNSGGIENQRDDGGLQTVSRGNLGTNSGHYFEDTDPLYPSEVLLSYGTGSWTRTPNSIPDWVDPVPFNAQNIGSDYKDRNVIYIPNVDESFSGTIEFYADISPSTTGQTKNIWTVWEDLLGGDVLFKALPTTIDNSNSDKLDFTIAKTELNLPPTNGGELYGIFIKSFGIGNSGDGTDILRSLINQSVTEEYVPAGVVAYDDYGQYVSTNVSLLHAAPQVSIKTLMAGLMQKEGLLIDIDSTTKVVKFFTYGEYQTKVENDEYNDWSNYFRKHESILYNTDYGNSYGVLNNISLSSPYPGNKFPLTIANQGHASKYKASVDNVVGAFRDISQVTLVGNTDAFFEYESKGLGLVEDSENPHLSLEQRRADQSFQGNFVGLPKMINVNYAEVPNGVREWYNLVDSAVKIEASFLLPITEIKNIDLSIPIFVNDLGGFWIIEEIAEYIDSQTIVIVKLIKLIDNLKV